MGNKCFIQENIHLYHTGSGTDLYCVTFLYSPV